MAFPIPAQPAYPPLPRRVPPPGNENCFDRIGKVGKAALVAFGSLLTFFFLPWQIASGIFSLAAIGSVIWLSSCCATRQPTAPPGRRMPRPGPVMQQPLPMQQIARQQGGYAAAPLYYRAHEPIDGQRPRLRVVPTVPMQRAPQPMPLQLIGAIERVTRVRERREPVDPPTRMPLPYQGREPIDDPRARFQMPVGQVSRAAPRPMPVGGRGERVQSRERERVG